MNKPKMSRLFQVLTIKTHFIIHQHSCFFTNVKLTLSVICENIFLRMQFMYVSLNVSAAGKESSVNVPTSCASYVLRLVSGQIMA